jgi:hypothetical protein
MSIAYWNTAQTLFWIITRQWPADALLDDDSISGLQLALPISEEAAKQISDATDDLRVAMRSGDRICDSIHHQAVELRSGTGGATSWGYYAKAKGSPPISHLLFVVDTVQKRWPAAKSAGAKRGRKEQYSAADFISKAVSILKKHRGIGPRLSQERFKAIMQEWCQLAQRILVSATAGGVRDVDTLKEQALRSLGGGLRPSGEQTCRPEAA